MKTSSSSPLYTTAEVALLLRLSRSRIQELVADGVLRPVRLTANSNYRFRKDEIDALIAPQAEPERRGE